MRGLGFARTTAGDKIFQPLSSRSLYSPIK